MARATRGRTTRVGVVGAAGAALLLASCGLTGPNTTSTKLTATTVKKNGGTSFPTVPYTPTTSTTTTTLASLNPGNSGLQPGPTPDSPGTYIVKAGDFGVIIARKFQITFAELQAANPDKNFDRLQPGDQLVIPPPSSGGVSTPTIGSPTATTRVPGATTTAAAKTGATYTVVSGDTLVGIAKKIGISVATLQQLNPGVTQNLQVGQKLNIPKGSSAPAATTTTKKP